MCVNSDSKHYEAYYDHVLNKKKSNGSTAKAYDVISLISDKRGLRQTWEEIDGEIQDEIIDELIKIIDYERR